METHTGKRPNPPEKALVSFQKADLKKKGKRKKKSNCVYKRKDFILKVLSLVFGIVANRNIVG